MLDAIGVVPSPPEVVPRKTLYDVAPLLTDQESDSWPFPGVAVKPVGADGIWVLPLTITSTRSGTTNVFPELGFLVPVTRSFKLWLPDATIGLVQSRTLPARTAAKKSI